MVNYSKHFLFFYCVILVLLLLLYFGVYIYVTVPRNPSLQLRSNDLNIVPSDKLENIFWFVQLSDIHISAYHDSNIVSDLKDFIYSIITIINPSLVLATGDLVDAKSEDGFSTHQNTEEWKIYYSILQETKIEEKIPWLDLRGNHDCFDVESAKHESNLFSNYSAMGRKHKLKSYMYVHKPNYGTYSFIGIDACPEPGLKRPFNFFGILTDRDVAELKLMAQETIDHNFTIWFAHYPTATLAIYYDTTLKPALKSSNSLAYLCGHLHHLGGISYTMYSRQPDGYLELELADWKVNRRYRIMAIDHDLASFVDTNYLNWPVILVTNPKEASLSVPIVEPLTRMKYSTHIRILIFSPHYIDSVIARVDGIELKELFQHIQGPLYVIKWHPSHYFNGLHTLQIEVNSTGLITRKTSSFSLDGQVPLYSIISNFILFSHPPSIIFYLYYIFWFICIILILLSLFAPPRIEAYLEILYWTRPLKKYTNVKIMWFIANIYPILGPWCIGVVSSHFSLGIIYLYGIQLPSGFIPLYYMYGIALEQLLTFNIPCTLILIVTAWGNKIKKRCRHISCFVFYVIIIYHLKRCYQFMRWIGVVGCIINPPITWMLVIFLYTYSTIAKKSTKQTV